MAKTFSLEQDYPVDAAPLSASSGNVAAGVATATLSCPAGKTMYITGFVISGAGATAGLPVSPTITGVVGGTMTFSYSAAVGALVANQPLIVNFAKALPATASNVNVVVSCPSLGSGNTNNTVVAYGYSR